MRTKRSWLWHGWSNARITVGKGSFSAIVDKSCRRCRDVRSHQTSYPRLTVLPTWAGEIFSSHVRAREDSGQNNFISRRSPLTPKTHMPVRCGDSTL